MKSDEELLLNLLDHLSDLDIYSAREAIDSFEIVIQETIKDVGQDRLSDYQEKKYDRAEAREDAALAPVKEIVGGDK